MNLSESIQFLSQTFFNIQLTYRTKHRFLHELPTTLIMEIMKTPE